MGDKEAEHTSIERLGPYAVWNLHKFVEDLECRIMNLDRFQSVIADELCDECCEAQEDAEGVEPSALAKRRVAALEGSSAEGP